MQFGVGLLGQGWTLEGQLARLRANTDGPRDNFHLHASCFAAKIAADTILSEFPTTPDLSDDGIVEHCAPCALPVRPSEAYMVREAFVSEYGQQSFELGAA